MTAWQLHKMNRNSLGVRRYAVTKLPCLNTQGLNPGQITLASGYFYMGFQILTCALNYTRIALCIFLQPKRPLVLRHVKLLRTVGKKEEMALSPGRRSNNGSNCCLPATMHPEPLSRMFPHIRLKLSGTTLHNDTDIILGGPKLIINIDLLKYRPD